MTRRLEFLAVLLSNLLIAAAYAFQQAWTGAIACLVLAAFWLIFNRRRIARLPSLCFVALAILAAFSLPNSTMPVLTLVGFTGGMAAWDLSDFAFRLESILPLEAALRLEGLHLKRLAFTLALGLAIGLAAISIHFELRFTTAFILGILAIAALAFAVRSVIKKNPDGF